MQIIILGMHRSGTSAVTRLVNMMGAHSGSEDDLLKAQADNPKGFWERKDIVECNDYILHECQASWDNVTNFVVPEALSPQTVDNIKRIVETLDQHPTWVAKDPRMCLTFSVWRQYLTKPLAIMVYRDPVEIAESLHTRDEIPVKMGLAMWEFYMVQALSSVLDVPKIFVRHADVLRDPVGTTQRLYEELNRRGAQELHMPSQEDITEFIDPALYHSRPDSHAFSLNEYQQELAAYASGQASMLRPLKITESSQEYLFLYSYKHTDRARIVRLTDEVNNLNIRASALEQHILELKTEIERLEAEATARQNEFVATKAQLEANLAAANNSASALNQRLDYIYSTLWWKLGRNFAAILRAVGLRR